MLERREELGADELDRLSGLLVLLGMACLAVLFSPLELEAWIVWFAYGLAGCAVAGLATVMLLARNSDLAAGRLRWLHDAGVVLRSPRVLLVSTLLSLLAQVGNVVVWQWWLL